MNFDMTCSCSSCLRKQPSSHPFGIVTHIYNRTRTEAHSAGPMTGFPDGYFGGDDIRNIAEPAKKMHVLCRWIPICETEHVWGCLIDRPYQIAACRETTGYLTHCKRVGAGFGSRVPAIAFHSHPSIDFYSDIPSVEDIFVFLRYKHLNYIVVGRNTCTIFGKTEKTLPAIIRLYNWEQGNKRQRAILHKRHPLEGEPEIEHRYITIALRNIGLKLPAKNYARRKVWVSAVRQLGIAVCQISRLTPSPPCFW